jgi:hypothetical protein
VTVQGIDSFALNAEPGAATLNAESAGELDVSAEGPGWLVTDQPWYPGWSADVDGMQEPVATLDGALVGVRLSPGSHLIRLRYSAPEGFGAGLLLAALAGLAVAGLWYADPSLSNRPGGRLTCRC